MPTSEDLYQRALQFLRTGDNQGVRELLKRVIRDDVHNVNAWMRYAGTLPSSEERIKVLRWCLKYNSDNEMVQSALSRLQRERGEDAGSNVRGWAGAARTPARTCGEGWARAGTSARTCGDGWARRGRRLERAGIGGRGGDAGPSFHAQLGPVLGSRYAACSAGFRPGGKAAITTAAAMAAANIAAGSETVSVSVCLTAMPT